MLVSAFTVHQLDAATLHPPSKIASVDGVNQGLRDEGTIGAGAKFTNLQAVLGGDYLDRWESSEALQLFVWQE